jgi:hypothetical protein
VNQCPVLNGINKCCSRHPQLRRVCTARWEVWQFTRVNSFTKICQTHLHVQGAGEVGKINGGVPSWHAGINTPALQPSAP